MSTRTTSIRSTSRPRPTVWRAITDGVETEQYYYGTRVDSDWSKGGRIVYAYPDGSVAADGEVLDIDPASSFGCRSMPAGTRSSKLAGPVTMAGTSSRQANGGSKLTVTTSGLVPGSKIATEFSGGIVSSCPASRPTSRPATPLSRSAVGSADHSAERAARVSDRARRRGCDSWPAGLVDARSR